jgi:diguanylate cyclase (GGDEF)-like protein
MRDMISFTFIDVDHFKQFNDQHGHLGGDDCLKLIAGALNSEIKRPGDIVCRYGGEKFVIVAPHSNDTVWRLAERCRRKIESLIIFHHDNNNPVQVTISLGVPSTIPAKG